MLSPDDLALFREVAGDRDPPTKQVKELWACVGRGGGKDSIASAVACIVALRDYSQYLRPGQKAVIMCLACDRAQAAIARGYIAGYFQEYPMLRALVKRETDDGIELTNGTEIVVATNNLRSVRGRTVVCAILDECAFYQTDGGASTDVEVHAALIPSLNRIPGSILIGISSAYKRSGLLYTTWQKHFGKPDNDILVVRGTTRQFNDTYPQSLIDAELERDPERAASEWLSEWRSDLSDLFDRELVEAAIDHGIIARPPRTDVEYRMYVDASGGRSDSFAAAVVHSEDDIVIIDALFESKPPFNSATTIKEVCALAARYRISVVHGDDYAAEILADAFKREGVLYQRAKQNRSEIYLESVGLWTANRIRLVDDRRAMHQLCSLQRKVSASGRDRVDHPRDMHDDVALVVCGAAVMAATDMRPPLVRRDLIVAKERLVEMPQWCRWLLGVLALGEDGRLAAIAFLADRYLYSYNPADGVPDDPAPVTLVDVWEGSVADAEGVLYQRLEQLHRECRAHAHEAVVPEDTLMSFHMSGRSGDVWPRKWLTTELPTLILPLSGYIERGEFKIARQAAERGLPLGGVFSLRPGEKVGQNPLQTAILVGLRRCLMWEQAADVPIYSAMLTLA